MWFWRQSAIIKTIGNALIGVSLYILKNRGEAMGTVISSYQLPDKEARSNRLQVYFKAIHEMDEPKSIGKELADELLACKPNRRSMKLEQIFNNVLDRQPDGVTIKCIDVMFNPEYKVDVLKILIAAGKRKNYSVIWPGRFEDGRLIYAEEGYQDYKIYELANYDITCVKMSAQ